MSDVGELRGDLDAAMVALGARPRALTLGVLVGALLLGSAGLWPMYLVFEWLAFRAGRPHVVWVTAIAAGMAMAIVTSVAAVIFHRGARLAMRPRWIGLVAREYGVEAGAIRRRLAHGPISPERGAVTLASPSDGRLSEIER